MRKNSDFVIKEKNFVFPGKKMKKWLVFYSEMAYNRKSVSKLHFAGLSDNGRLGCRLLKEFFYIIVKKKTLMFERIQEVS